MFDIVVGPRLVFRRGKMSMLDTWTCCGTWACLAVAHLLDATIGFCGVGWGLVTSLHLHKRSMLHHAFCMLSCLTASLLGAVSLYLSFLGKSCVTGSLLDEFSQ